MCLPKYELDTSRKQVKSVTSLAKLFIYIQWQPKRFHSSQLFTLSLMTRNKPQIQREVYKAVIFSRCSYSNTEVIPYVPVCSFFCRDLCLLCANMN